MCGIVGYVGGSNAVPFLLEGLGRLEYRGYDSAGAAVLSHGKIEIRKAIGHVSSLVEEIKNRPLSGSTGISHTRWATHGGVTLENAHPHRDASGRLALVHNGVVENHKDLRAGLESRGHVFASQTDTEVISRLIGEAFDGHGEKNRESLLEALREALRQVRGTYAIGVLHEDLGDFLVAARRGSPLALGLGDDGQFLASDPAAVAGWAGEFVYLNDGEIAWLDGDGFEVSTIDGSAAAPVVVRSLDITAEAGDKGGFEHFMLKEIHEQPDMLREAMRGRLVADEATARFKGIERTPEELRLWENLILTGCGTSFNAALAGEYLEAAPPEARDRCLSMRGLDVTAHVRPAHLLFEQATVPTIGIGDGGNEIGMGTIGWEVIHRNIPQGGRIACRVATNHTIVAGVSNWGAWALAGLWRKLAGAPPLPDSEEEFQLLELMGKEGPLVDGVTGRRLPTVDGLAWYHHARMLGQIREALT